MRPSAFRKSVYVVLVCALVAFLLVLPTTMQADQAQYFYDERGHLIGVVDGNGDVAVYTYDEVGNLLSIERFTTGATGIGVFLLTPASALVGTDVEIRGFGFSTTPTANQVAFNGTPATVVSSTADSIVATVPTSATTGPVTVTNTNGIANSPKDFVVLVPPIIAGIDPDTVARGTTVQAVITGFSLDTVTAVQFSDPGLTATILSGVTEQSLPISLTTTGTVPQGEHTFSVISPLGEAQSGLITVTVTPGVPSFGIATLSVFLPQPAAVPASGPSVATNKASVFRPFPAQTPPSGPSAGVAPSVSVENP